MTTAEAGKGWLSGGRDGSHSWVLRDTKVSWAGNGIVPKWAGRCDNPSCGNG